MKRTVNLSLTIPVSCNNAQADIPYGCQPQPHGGVPPYTYTLTGQLPRELSFSTQTGAITGTPSQSGQVPVSITVHDSRP